MLPALLSLPAKLTTLLGRLTSTRATKLDYLDVAISSRSSLTQAQAASGVWAAATRTLTTPAGIKGVQRGTLYISSGTSLTVSITPVTAAKSFVVSTISGPWYDDANSRVRLALASNGASLVATRDNYQYSSGVVAFEVIEFY